MKKWHDHLHRYCFTSSDRSPLRKLITTYILKIVVWKFAFSHKITKNLSFGNPSFLWLVCTIIFSIDAEFECYLLFSFFISYNGFSPILPRILSISIDWKWLLERKIIQVLDKIFGIFWLFLQKFDLVI